MNAADPVQRDCTSPDACRWPKCSCECGKKPNDTHGVKGTPLVPCPVCGGEAVHAQDVLARTTIAPAVTECPLCLNDASVGRHGVSHCIVAGATTCRAQQHGASEWVCDCAAPGPNCKPTGWRNAGVRVDESRFCGYTATGLRKVADGLDQGIVECIPGDCTNTQDELDRMVAARVLRALAATLGVPGASTNQEKNHV